MIKFKPSDEIEDTCYYEVGLDMWLTENDTQTFWPPPGKSIQSLILKKVFPGKDWSLHPVEVKRKYSK